MCFFVRPGPLKQELLPLITAGGGLLCNVQKSGSILSKTQRRERPCQTVLLTEERKLNIEDYRLTQESTNSAKTKTKSKVGSPAISGGRAAYTPEEDEAILNYVSKHVKEIGGNKLWQEMEKQQVTSHSWQSMKYRYRVQLAARLFEYKPADTEKEDKAQNTEQTEPEIKTEGSESPQNISAETEDPKNISSDIDLTQVSQSSDSQEEQTEAQPAKSRDTEMCDSMETSKSEIDETPEQQQPSASHHDEEPDSTETTKSAPNSNTNTSPCVVNRPVTRKQVELENMPYVKKLRSGASPGMSPGSLFKWPKLLSKSKSASSPKRDPKEALAPPKKVRKKTESSVSEQIQEETQQSDPSEPTQTDEGNSSAAQPSEKKTVKRKLGILEMATKEFEDDSESGSDLQDETPGPSTSIEAVAGSSNSPNPSTAVSENQENEVAPAQPEQNPQTSTANTTTSAVTTPAPDKASTSDPVTSEPHISETTSKAHLFIFENESQELEEEEEETQCLEAPGTSATDQTNQPRNSPSLTQDQLEEDVKLLKDCMQQTNQDLVSVTKALLKASGDVALALEILQEPSSFSGPVWTQTDDQRLCSSDSQMRQDLLTKYGEEGVAKRLMFLEMEV
ncbi:hypothetical protein WMY93_011461 [Mugilogobius chulae]|uniref:Telomeric repeat-binding factor 2-interacting protein 1 n=1 Tax=Mugilogobius chulae TaxID=88201 RepID=A0AAW0P2W9_9GOBI